MRGTVGRLIPACRQVEEVAGRFVPSVKELRGTALFERQDYLSLLERTAPTTWIMEETPRPFLLSTSSWFDGCRH